MEIDEGPIVQAGAAHPLLGNLKAEPSDKMKRGLHGCAGARNRPGVLRNLRLYQHYLHDIEALAKGLFGYRV